MKGTTPATREIEEADERAIFFRVRARFLCGVVLESRQPTTTESWIGYPTFVLKNGEGTRLSDNA